MKAISGKLDILTLMLVLVPVPLVAKFMGMPPVVIFITACLGIIPLAGFMGKGTEHLSDHVGPGKGALLNAFFGNACEFILAIFALHAGLVDVVKASLTGSIMGNVLLVLGASMFAGGLRRETQFFNKTAASTSATLLALAAFGLIMPACMHHVSDKQTGQHVSLAISGVLIFMYVASLIFSLKTHKAFYGKPVGAEGEEAIGVKGWSKRKAITVLCVSTIAVAVIAETLVGAIEQAAHTLGMSEIFVGVILVAIVGNAAENSSAVLMAAKNKMDLSINIALGSATQIALLVAPALVFIGYGMGQPMNLIFSEMELVAVVISVAALKFVVTDGESNWLEGLLLMAVYTILGCCFFFA